MYAIIRIAKHSSNGSLGAMKKHNKREMPVPNADPKETKYNQEIVGTGDYVKDVNEAIAKSNVHAQKNSVKAIEHVMTATPEFFSKYTTEEMKIEDGKERYKAFLGRRDKWVKANVEFLKEHYGPHSVVASVSLHLDELTPHLHAFVVPVTQGKLRGGREVNRLGAKAFTGDTKVNGKRVSGKQKLQNLQNKYAEKMAPFGLERGIKYSSAKHVTMKKLHTNMARAEEYTRNKKYEIPLIDSTPPIVGRDKWVENQNEVITEKMTSFVEGIKAETNDNAFLSAAELLSLSKRKIKEDRDARERAQLIDKTTKAVKSHEDKIVGLELKNEKLSLDLEDKKVDNDKWFLNYSEAKSDIKNMLNGTITPERLKVLKFEITRSEQSQKRLNQKGNNNEMKM